MCNKFTIKRTDKYGPNGYLHSIRITSNPLFNWTTRQQYTVSHGPKENMLGLLQYIGDAMCKVVKCPCDSMSNLPAKLRDKQSPTVITSDLVEDFISQKEYELTDKAKKLLGEN